jgi:hypothetical protein
MTETMLTARCDDRTWQVRLKLEGSVLGRGGTCDVVIDQMEVSRRHARASCDAWGRWVFEDLGSSNGLFLNGLRVEACTVRPGDVVRIGSVFLALGEAPAPPIRTAALPPVPHVLVQDFGTEVFYDKPRLEDCTTPPCPDRIGPMRERLSQPLGLPALYAEACQILAERPKTVAVVFQVAQQNETSARMPVLLAYQLAEAPADTRAHPDSEEESPYQALRVSHRLLEAVRTGGKPLMTKTVFSCDTSVTMSLIDEHSPRAVMCVPLAGDPGVVNLLYVDFPIDERVRPGPEEMFAFVQAVAKQLASPAA